MKRNWIVTLFLILVGTIAAVAFVWLVLLKLFAKIMGGRDMPCPASLGWLVDNPLRRRYMRPILDRVGIQPGETVLEVGPGPGAFTLDAARRVGPGGRVVAVDIQPAMIARLEARVRAAGLGNVAAHVASAYEIPLPDASVDRAFLVTVLPEIGDPVRALREIRRVLKPAGLLSVTEEFLDPDYPRRATTIAWARAAGFELQERLGSFWVYTLNFRRVDPCRPEKSSTR
jgi:SAM-dependent methyltransferase